jgi:BCD family chlorophyll transporter-like MFS transporter
MNMTPPSFGWPQILRLGLVQACLGAVVVVTTSTLNRVMVVELALPALLPGFLVAWHYGVQMVRPRMGFGADQGRRNTPWMLGGMAVLGAGGVLAALATVWMGSERLYGALLALLAFAMIGLGVSACGTSLLALMAKRVPDARRAPAATAVWMMMILGFAVTAGVVGKLIEPYSPGVLLRVSCGLSLLTLCITSLALWRLEGPATTSLPVATDGAPAPQAGNSLQGRNFRQAFAAVWDERAARTFTVFVFLSMLAYSAQDLVLEPFAGAVHGFSPGQTTQLSGWHHMGVLFGMIAVAFAGSARARGRLGTVQAWMVGGCLASALATVGLSWAALQTAWPLQLNVVVLGVANGAFSIAAIATMMRLASEGGPGREGTRMGLWGAAQALAFGLGGLVGTGASDLAHLLLGGHANAYASVFALQAVMFAVSAVVALRLATPRAPSSGTTPVPLNDPSFERG